jgi:hypothetical protein
MRRTNAKLLGAASVVAVRLAGSSRARRTLCACTSLVVATVAFSARAPANGIRIERSKITGSTKRDPFVTRGSYSLSVRGADLVARWRGTVRRTTHLRFLIYPDTKSGGNLPGFHGEGPQQSLRSIARKGRHRTVTVVFNHPKVVRGWPCVQGNVIDEPDNQPRVWPLLPMTFHLLCPRGGFPT